MAYHLINLGALGTAAYAAVFLTALRKYRRNSMAIMLLLLMECIP